jgi:uncharacterized protein YceK
MSLVLVLVAAFSGGCGTLANIKRPEIPPPNKPDAQVVRVYGGVREDWALISEYPWDRTVSFLDYVFIPVLAGIDLTFDLGADTVTLPYTLYTEGRRAFNRPDTPNAPDAPNTPSVSTRPGPAPPATPVPTPGSTPSATPGSAPVPPSNR